MIEINGEAVVHDEHPQLSAQRMNVMFASDFSVYINSSGGFRGANAPPFGG